MIIFMDFVLLYMGGHVCMYVHVLYTFLFKAFFLIASLAYSNNRNDDFMIWGFF